MDKFSWEESAECWECDEMDESEMDPNHESASDYPEQSVVPCPMLLLKMLPPDADDIPF